MADQKISALTAAASALDASELPVNEAGTSKKVTVAQMKADVARVVASYSATGQTASISSQTLLASPPNGVYRVTCAMAWEATGNGCGLTNLICGMNFPWERFSIDQSVPSFTISSILTFSPAADGCSITFLSYGGEDITVGTTYGAGDSNDAYRVTFILERLPTV